MKKLLKNVLIIVVVAILLVISKSEVFAKKYDEESFEIEVSDNYKQTIMRNGKDKLYTYINESDLNNTYIIMQMKDINYAKEFIDDDKMRLIFGSDTNLKRKNLNGYEAVFIEGYQNDIYMQGYLLYSNNYNYLIAVTSKNKNFFEEKESKDYFKSFRIKDTRFNLNILFGIIAIIIIIIAAIKQYKSKILKISK